MNVRLNLLGYAERCNDEKAFEEWLIHETLAEDTGLERHYGELISMHALKRVNELCN